MTAVDPLVADLRDRRIAAGLSQRQLSRAIGWVPSHVSMLEAGQRNPTLPTLRCWAQALGLEPALVPLTYRPGFEDPTTAPAEGCTPAGNGAPEGGLKSPPVVPASARSLVAAAGSDVAHGDDHQTFCRCGHPWVQHIAGQLADSELCCVDGCDMTRCPGSAVARTLDVAVATVAIAAARRTS